MALERRGLEQTKCVGDGVGGRRRQDMDAAREKRFVDDEGCRRWRWGSSVMSLVTISLEIGTCDILFVVVFKVVD